jgi:metal transporter CNNM
MKTMIIWFGIFFCISQSAIFSGLNLALFSISKLRLEIESLKKNKLAIKMLDLRRDSNFLLTTILWGNVGINVLLALLSNSVLTGVIAFLFSTFLITLIGEIVPQAYFSRHAMRTASFLAPVLRIYQVLLYPVAKPTALLLDKWLGPEAIRYFQERDLRELIKMHIESSSTEIDLVEGIGALNFLAIDDLGVVNEGEIIEPRSIITLRFEGKKPIFPTIEPSPNDKFLKLINSSGKKWIIITDSDNEPKAVLDSDGFIRDALFSHHDFNPYFHCHRPIIIRDPHTNLGETILRLKVYPARSDDDVIDEDIILLWSKSKRVITGSDILGRLLRGIVQQEKKVLDL